MAEKAYIEREAAYKACEAYLSGVCVYDVSESEVINDFEKVIDAVPTADVAPVKHGHWIYENFYTHCSVCGKMAIYDKYGQEVESDYCPRCGAKMGGEGE